MVIDVLNVHCSYATYNNFFLIKLFSSWPDNCFIVCATYTVFFVKLYPQLSLSFLNSLSTFSDSIFEKYFLSYLYKQTLL